jgi:hypothetical protein
MDESTNNTSSFFVSSEEKKIEPIITEPVLLKEKTPKPKTVSFSQYAMWLKCPHRWKLSYIDYLSKYDDNINTIFGDAIHIPLQEYLSTLYTKGTIEADAINMYALFEKTLDEGLKKLKIATDAQVKMLAPEDIEELGLITPALVEEFKQDGKNILDHVRRKHFPSKQYEFIGVELPLFIPIRGGKIVYKGYLDLVLRDKNTKKILIIDIKTSTNGWNKWQKVDRTKLDQLLLYKRFYSMTHNIPMSDIEVEFFIVKRKLLENVAYPQQRIQRFSPPDGKMSIKAVEQAFFEFINECFTQDGLPNKEHIFSKNPDKAKKNCKYCQFKTMINSETGKPYCDAKEDKIS